MWIRVANENYYKVSADKTGLGSIAAYEFLDQLKCWKHQDCDTK